jgi:hypothetical protein
MLIFSGKSHASQGGSGNKVKKLDQANNSFNEEDNDQKKILPRKKIEN